MILINLKPNSLRIKHLRKMDEMEINIDINSYL